MTRKEDALAYHRAGRPGKIEVVPTKPVSSQRELSLAYSPGVAEPCRAIHADPAEVDTLTARRNLVAVITNGTAVLGLGDIGPLAAKPVMEGKAVLFKKYADIDVFDIEVDAKDPERFIDVVAALEPTFGGINLEDIKAPECFYIEEQLRSRLHIPVFHDDQHGTAIISAAALTNACELQGKRFEDLKVTCIGAGAAAMGCMRLWTKLGVKPAHVTLVDVDGVVKVDREGLDETRRAFARPADDPRSTLAEALEGADVMIGLSAGGIVSGEMLKTMAERPIVFALANPDPEIGYEEARAARPDAIVGTGRSDFPNQVNNVLGFPYIFRGALDVGATGIDDRMKLAAADALARLAREGVSDDVLAAYGGEAMKFGPDYVIPKPMDMRSLHWVAPAVAEAAIASGLAQRELDVQAYRHELERKLDPTRRVMWQVTSMARKDPRRVVFPEGEEDTILRAADIVESEGIARPVLIGRPAVMRARAEELGVDLEGVEIVDRSALPALDEYAEALWTLRRRKGMTRARARRALEKSRTAYGMMMVQRGEVDGLVSGLTSPYPDTIRPALQIVGVAEGVRRACGCYMVVAKEGVKFFADTTVNIDPDAETLAEVAVLTADLVRELGIEPRLAMLSFSNFGDAPHPHQRKVSEATARVKRLRPDLQVEGEMQADVALLESARGPYPFASLEGAANVLIFPNLSAGNIAYKLLSAMGSEVIGPLVLGMRRPVNVLQQGASVSTVVHMTALTVARAGRMG
ncbi:MAG TPA: NADP-dependent malic enzyme [Polyangiaceae bacterium LLY-WYZ-15_(1-7)]|nr:NADP-dependent malic enzyme [Myxococcales bacterium]MAT28535.1 NADP-dependent malic enzyme [Sandaracinus sp.]HJK93918.1 NADP-dependent malic enzyme [Polyangiaceae bacterium LLY-WYZ-15_(1-7)]MBJ74826.1 NADP-dependent malic enzyme [Sandaracinus sp.]HJL01579.1 NADP-dependent malic enzyme [Polyangiaceae bacterium LLY-WYZ-15_(1-7)]